MKKILFFCFLISFVQYFTFVSLALCVPMYTKSAGTKVMSEKKGSSKLVKLLAAGVEVDKLDDSGRWSRVRLDSGEVGWVFKFKLSSEKPEDIGDDGDLFGGLIGAMGGDEIVAKEASTGGNIRGLKEVARSNAKAHRVKKEYIEQFAAMQRFRLKKTDLTNFLKDGKLGEYME